MKLYHCPKTRSVRPLWLLEELGVEYELETIDIFKGEGQTEEYKQINPAGTLPTLDDNGKIIFEAGAICLYLTDLYPEKNLAPKIDSPDRALFYQWMFYVPATMEPPLWQIFFHSSVLPEEKRIPEVIELSKKQFQRVANVLNKALINQPYILGEHFSAADIMIASTLHWYPELIEGYGALQDYKDTLSERPAYQIACSK